MSFDSSSVNGVMKKRLQPKIKTNKDDVIPTISVNIADEKIQYKFEWYGRILIYILLSKN